MLGSTVPTIGGFHTGFRRGDDWGCECIQIYVTLSRKWYVPKLTRQEVAAFQKERKQSAVKIVAAHVPYLVNIASPDNALRSQALERLEIEFSRCEAFGVPILILHSGGHKASSKEEGLQRVIDALDHVHQTFEEAKTRILLETMAGQGTMLGGRFEELAAILAGIKSPERLGVCFDTAHVFAAGYDIRGYEGYESVLSEFDRVIGLGKIEAFHINDTFMTLGCRCDRHAWIGDGNIGMQTFHALVKDEQFASIPKILEMPQFDKKSQENLELLRQLKAISEPMPEMTREDFRQRFYSGSPLT